MAAAEAVEAVAVEAAVLPPAEAADADKKRKDDPNGHPFYIVARGLMRCEHILRIK